MVPMYLIDRNLERIRASLRRQGAFSVSYWTTKRADGSDQPSLNRQDHLIVDENVNQANAPSSPPVVEKIERNRHSPTQIPSAWRKSESRPAMTTQGEKIRNFAGKVWTLLNTPIVWPW